MSVTRSTVCLWLCTWRLKQCPAEFSLSVTPDQATTYENVWISGCLCCRFVCVLCLTGLVAAIITKKVRSITQAKEDMSLNVVVIISTLVLDHFFIHGHV
uniref:Uncharacterized protein n=1 Tax=Trypanosoma congolense (strain IL3000) TaxID=1068625 RepID=G0UM35_TRYCI|nr:hypothetical protein, unlikely [Trypanosoma congolense IL3000]